MKKRNKNKIIHGIVTCFVLMIMMLPMVASAATNNNGTYLDFSSVYVHGNYWTVPFQGRHLTTTSSANLIVTRMNDDENKSSDYKLCHWYITDYNGNQISKSDDTTSTLNVMCKIPYLRDQAANYTVRFSAKGNKSDLDTYISGQVSNFNK